jgi:hypothetical protein
VGGDQLSGVISLVVKHVNSKYHSGNHGPVRIHSDSIKNTAE